MAPFDFSSFVSVRNVEGDEIRAQCPFHEDRNPSFSANTKSGLWICHRGCGGGTYNQFLRFLKGKPVNGSPTGKRPSGNASEDWSVFRPVSHYIYLNSDGGEELRVRRFEDPHGHKRFAQEHKDARAGWVKGKTDRRVYPYRFQHWSQFGKTEPILVVEGEKCVDALFGRGLLGTTFAGGSNGWRSYYAPLFKDRNVVILPDQDFPGQQFAAAVAAGTQGVAASLKTVLLPGLAEGEDVVDWFRKGGTAEQLKQLM